MTYYKALKHGACYLVSTQRLLTIVINVIAIITINPQMPMFISDWCFLTLMRTQKIISISKQKRL